MMWDFDAYYFKSYCLFQNTFLKVRTKGFNNKDFSCFKKLKLKDPKLAPSFNNTVESAKKKNKKNKKKKF